MRAFFTISFLFLALLFHTTALAQSGKITGFVTDSKTGEPIIGANVLIMGTTVGAATDVEGYYVILNVKPGYYDVKVSSIGYAAKTLQGVRVNINQTTELNFQLEDKTYQTEDIVVVAEEPIVKQDVSSSNVNLNIKEIESLPVSSVESVISLQAGVQFGSEGPIIRGGGVDQTQFMVNGISMRDERNNVPYTGVSLTAVDEVQVQTGGFNAEYGNIRSGLVNVVTKEGSKQNYTFSFLGRYSPASHKQFGPAADDINAFWLRPYTDPATAFVGTLEGWDGLDYLQGQYPEFAGFNAVSLAYLIDDDPTNDMSPKAAQQIYLWQHRKALTITKPDYTADFSFGGPVPFVSEDLGNLRFFFSFRRSETQYLIPLSHDSHDDESFQLKVTSDLAPGMKLTVEGLISQETGTTRSSGGLPLMFTSSSQISNVLSRFSQYKTTENRIYTAEYWCPSTADRNSIGAKFTHVLSDQTYYEVRFSRFESEYNTNPSSFRDTTRIYKFGDVYVDEGPVGYFDNYTSTPSVNNFRMSIGFSTARDTSKVVAYNLKFDITSQVDKFNNIKAGFEFNLTDQNVSAGQFDPFLPDQNRWDRWDETPIRASLYVQDKFEYEGMIANIGLRLDYSDANTQWWVWDPYTEAFAPGVVEGIDTLLTQEDTDKILNLSPRLGIAFPISINSKLYFNYGHFYSMPDPIDLYLFRQMMFDNRVSYVANPNSPLPRTVAYELGYEHNLFDMFLVRVAGYYKDVSDQPTSVNYVSRDGKVNYTTAEPNSYADIRGFEFTLTKNRGDWIQGFINYTYSVSTSGRFGFYTYYENAAEQERYERITTSNEQFKPIPQPYARASIDIFTPSDFGPEFAGMKLLADWRMNLLASWSNGSYFTWTGGSGDIPGVQNNVQWTDYYGVDLRFSKNFDFGFMNMQLFVDVSNVFNIKRMTGPGYAFIDAQDYLDYMQSLHLPESAFEDFPKDADGVPQPGYSNWREGGGFVFGDDQPGDYRIGPYIPWDENASEEEKAEWRENKSYINMPNQNYLTFLNPRDIFWGLRFTVTL